MKSSELAALADVSVRTLRHYHQVGVMAEPERGINGYRHYTVNDLVRLLRIRRLAAVGIPLEKMSAMLDTTPAGDTALLDQITSDLDAEIERLQRQKALIELIRVNDSAPDFPPELAPYIALFAASGASSATSQMDREQAILLAHLVGEAGMDRLAAVYERVADESHRAEMVALATSFEALTDESSEQDIAAYIDRFMEETAPLIASLQDTSYELQLDEKKTMKLFGEYQYDVLNAAQRAVMERIMAKVSELG